MHKFLISKEASDKINMLNLEEQNKYMFRIKVEGGGCNGYKYQISFTDFKYNNDIEFNQNGACVIIDNVSIFFLRNARLEYTEELGHSSFFIKNPNFQSYCGCGASFSFDV